MELILYLALLSGAATFLLPRPLRYLQTRWGRLYGVVAVVMSVVIVVLQPIYFFFGLWGVAERPMAVAFPWPLVVFPMYIGIFFAALLIQKLEKVGVVSLGLASYTSLALSWPLAAALLNKL